MKKLLLLLLLAVMLVIVGCSSMTLNSAKRSGDTLDTRDIFNLVSGNTLVLTAYDFDGTFYFNEQGKVSGVDNEGQKDTGSWDIKNNDQLCIRFKVWYYGDLKCYSIVANDEQNQVSFFTSNGAAYYSGKLVGGDSIGLGKEIKPAESSKFVRKKLSDEQAGTPATETGKNVSPAQVSSPAPSSAVDTSSSVRQLAQKCNGCNLSGVDLKEATLVKAQLEGADLSRADLRYANLRRARLAGANLSGARLNHANLPGADLRNCNLTGADLSGANLLLADLTGADLSGATLTNAHLENTIGLKR